MAEQQRTNRDREIAGYKGGWAAGPGALALSRVSAVLVLAAGALAFAAPQVANPTAVPPPAASTQPDNPAIPTNVPPIAASLIAQAKIGDAQMAAKEYDAAIATFRSLLPLASDRGKGDLWAHIGEAYRLQGDYPSSIQAFEKAFALVPTDPRVASNLGVLYEAQDDKIHARQYYEKSIAINPNNALILNNLAFLLTEINGDLDQALTYARAAQAKMPDAPEIDDTIGWIDLKKNMIPGAIAEFRKITLAQPNNSLFHYHYAMALKRQGNLADAAKECRAAMSHGPDKDLEAKLKVDCAAPLPGTK